jgi:hypothetical protein
MTVQELGLRMGSKELTEWMAYFELDPFGNERGDLQAGIIAATVANSSMNRAKGSKALMPSEFMPDFSGNSKTIKPDSPELMEAKMRQLSGRYSNAHKP